MRSGIAARFRKLALLVAFVAAACHAGGLYTAQVPVASQSDSDRAEALRNALAQIVIRVSGDAGALARPDVAKAVAGAERYVQRFQYQQEAASDAAGQPPHLSLSAQFDRDAVDELLRGFGLLHEAASAEQTAGVDNTPGLFRLWVGGIRSGRDYARLIGSIAGNERVRDVQVEVARGDGVQLRVATVGSLARLLDALGAGVLRVTNAQPPVEGLDAMLELKP